MGFDINFYVVYITASNMDEASSVAKTIVERGIVKCVNIVKDVRSIYLWQGNVEDDGEVLMVCKLKRENFTLLQETVKKLHSYDVPELIALPIVDGSKEYLDWLNS